MHVVHIACLPVHYYRTMMASTWIAVYYDHIYYLNDMDSLYARPVNRTTATVTELESNSKQRTLCLIGNLINYMTPANYG